VSQARDGSSRCGIEDDTPIFQVEIAATTSLNYRKRFMEVSIEQKRSSRVSVKDSSGKMAIGQMNTIAGSSRHPVMLIEVCKGRWRHDARRTGYLGCVSVRDRLRRRRRRIDTFLGAHVLSEENVRREARKAGVFGEGGRRQEGECGGGGSRRNDAGCNIENRPEDG
jgi:hypothetical protein